MLTTGFDARTVGKEIVLPPAQPAKRRHSDPLLKQFGANTKRTFPKDTCDVNLDTRGEDCRIQTWGVRHSSDELPCPVCRRKAADAWNHYPSERARVACEGLLDLKRKGVSSSSRVIPGFVPSTNCLCDHRDCFFSFKRQQRRYNKPLCALCGK